MVAGPGEEYRGVMDEGADPPTFDEHLARHLIGKRVIVGMTYLSHEGAFLERKQFHGVVAVADARRGICIKPSCGEKVLWLPPDLRGFREAPRGQYRLRSTGEVIVDPDYLCTWTENAPR